MMLRLVLVSSVAVLGFTVPSQNVCEDWLDSAQTWASAFLADCDRWTPGARGSCTFAGSEAGACEQCRLARERRAVASSDGAKPESVAAAGFAANCMSQACADTLPADVFTPTVVAFDPIAVPAAGFEDLADELNGLAANSAEEPVAMDQAPDARPGTDGIVGAVSDNLEIALLGELMRTLEKTLADSKPIPADPPEFTEPLDVDPSMLCGVPDDDLDDFVAATTSFGVQTTAEVAPLADACLDPEPEVASDEEERVVDASASPTPQPVAELPWPAFTPGGSAEKPEARVEILAGASRTVTTSEPVIGRPAESQTAPASKSQVQPRSNADNSPRNGGFEQAVELTRNAAVAWMRVLTGPALVRVTAR
jgi:hypothetical protein